MIRRLNAIRNYISFISHGKAVMYLKYRLDLVPDKRHGIYIYDISGKRYMNFHCNGGVYNLGHNNHDIAAALEEAVEKYDVGSSLAHGKMRELLAKKISVLMPGNILSVLLCASGSEANDAAIKTAMRHTGRTKVISLKGAYHGGSGLAMTAGDDAFKTPFGPLPECFVQLPFGDAEALEKNIDDDTAAVIFETIPATLGMPLPPDGYLESIRVLCTAHGAVMIADEVQTGLSRTGRFLGIDNWGVKPDVVVLGKGLSGGLYPIAAACFTPGLSKTFSGTPFLHRTEYGGSDLGCVAALKVIEKSSSPEFLNQVNETADFFSEELGKLRNKFPDVIEEIRQKGLFIGIVFKNENTCLLMLKILFDKGIYTVYAGNDKRVLQFLPSLIITRRQSEKAIEIVEKSIKDMKSPLYRILRSILESSGS